MHRNLRLFSLTAMASVFPRRIYAHTETPLTPSALWTAWTLKPVVLVILLTSAALYAVGVRRLWAKRAGAGIRPWEAASFAAGWLAAAIALVSPLHALGGSLFSAHMAQHEVLIALSAPLLVLGRPLVPFLWALPRGWRVSAGSVFRSPPAAATWKLVTLPAVAFALHAVALWIWHLPGPYQATMHNDLTHTLQHASFMSTALLFWWTIFAARGSTPGYGGAVFYLFTTALQTGALGALLTFAPTLWYPAYAGTSNAWGLSPIEDQQLGGLIMWIPGSIPYLIAGLVMFARWLRQSETRVARHYPSPVQLRTLGLLLTAILITSCDRASGDDRYQLTNADPDRGRAAIARYGCGSCHDIPGVTGARGLVGPPLGRVSQRVFIAGVLPNQPDNMIRWIENPPAIDSKTAMPNMGVTTRDARDISAYLYSLR